MKLEAGKYFCCLFDLSVLILSVPRGRSIYYWGCRNSFVLFPWRNSSGKWPMNGDEELRYFHLQVLQGGQADVPQAVGANSLSFSVSI